VDPNSSLEEESEELGFDGPIQRRASGINKKSTSATAEPFSNNKEGATEKNKGGS